jgi:hypothetical protein
MSELAWYVYLIDPGSGEEQALPGDTTEQMARETADLLNEDGWLRSGVQARVDQDRDMSGTEIIINVDDEHDPDSAGAQ